MGSARTPLEALDAAIRFAGDVAADHADVKIRILNDASDRIWMFAPWSWTIGQIAGVSLVEDQEDYTFTDPTDLMHFVKAEVRRANVDQTRDLKIVHSLPTQTAMKGSPTSFSKVNATTFRLSPVPSGLNVGDEGTVFSWYKKNNVVIVETTPGAGQAADDDEASLLMPDEWFWVYQDWVLYYAYKLMGDDRAGGVRIDGTGNAEYSGQLAVGMDGLFQMARKEKLFLDNIGQGVNG